MHQTQFSRRSPLKDALSVRDTVRQTLAQGGVDATCTMAITDSGPKLEVQVDSKRYGKAEQVLSAFVEAGTVKLLKKN